MPHTPFPQLALGARIQFALNGMLLIFMAEFLLALPHSVSARSALVMVDGDGGLPNVAHGSL